jgi:hypothetical protein
LGDFYFYFLKFNLGVFNFLLVILGVLIFFFWYEEGGGGVCFTLVIFEHFLFHYFEVPYGIFNFSSCHFVSFQKNKNGLKFRKGGEGGICLSSCEL